MKFIVFGLLATLVSTSAFAGTDCSDSAIKAAGDSYDKLTSDMDLMPRLTQDLNGEQTYVVDIVTQYSDGVSTEEFLEASYDVLIQATDARCQVLSVSKK